MDEDLFEEFLKRIADRFTAEELCEKLELDVWDIIEAFRDKIIELDEETFTN